MSDIGNLIDLTDWSEPVKDETVVEDIPTKSNDFKGPYDPFDSIEKEACIKGEHFKNDLQLQKTQTSVDIDIQIDDQDLNNETPPVAMESVPTNPDGIKNSSVNKDSRHRSLQQLAKLNATRLSTMNTPMNNQSTNAISSYFENSFLSENLQMIEAESPVKLIEDEPSPIPNTSSSSALSDNACSNTEFKARLKMMRIAILDTPSKSNSPERIICDQEPAATSTTPTTINVNSPAQAANGAEVAKLIQDLKPLIYKHVDISKREEVDRLIDSLLAVLDHKNTDAVISNQTTKESPHVYTRQGTFDLDLEQQKTKAESTDYLKTLNGNVQEFPDAMTCSSATYDAEPVDVDKSTSPIAESKSRKQSPNETQQKPESLMIGEVNDNLAHQINELLERHNLTKMQINVKDQQHHESDHNDNKSGGGQTVILVVNSTGTNQMANCITHPPTTPAVKTVANNKQDNAGRRRSSSLSIHDKANLGRPKSLVKPSSDNGSHHVTVKELSNAGDKCTPMTAFRQRRNSFSLGSTTSKPSAPAITRGRVSAISESTMKPSAPTKANIPIKHVVPMVRPSLVPTEMTYLNSTTPRCNSQDTPLTTKGKTGGKFFCTSTPMPQMRALQRRSLKPVSSYSSSCTSTPSVRAAYTYSKKAAQ